MGDEAEFDLTEWKLEINNMLWMRLPGNTTLQEAEALACELVQEVEHFYNRRPPRVKKDNYE